MKIAYRIFAVLCLSALLSCNVQPASPVALPVHPNIIFILTDDMAMSDLAYMPKTKKLIGENGASFSHFFISLSLCCPSRTSILRGQYAHNTQILDNELPNGGFEKAYQLGLEHSMLPVWLQTEGYRTALFGKYLNGYPNLVEQTYIPPGWNEWYSPAAGSPYTEFNYTLNENGKLVEYGDKAEDYGTDVYAAKAIDFIKRNVNQNQPFFAYIATYAPHRPSTPAPRHAGMFQSVELPRPPSFNESDMTDKTKTFLWRPPLSEEQINTLQDRYRLRLESLRAVDDMVANIVSTLESLNQLDNTYIFFTSDNGIHLGQHRLMEGKNTPYEEDILVPLLVSGPGIRAGLKVNALAGNIDLAPTIGELAGASMPDFVDGRSLVPWLQGYKVSNWRQAYLLERGLTENDQSSQDFGVGFHRIPAWMSGLLEPPDLDFDQQPGIYRGLRTDRYLYIEFSNGTIQIYDLQKDPYELQNFASTATPALLDKFHTLLSKLQNCAGESCRANEISP